MSFSAVQKIPQLALHERKWEIIYHSWIFFEFPDTPGAHLTDLFPHFRILACYSDIGY